jgi:hypothetical protein
MLILRDLFVEPVERGTLLQFSVIKMEDLLFSPAKRLDYKTTSIMVPLHIASKQAMKYTESLFWYCACCVVRRSPASNFMFGE